jgi:glycosyltransferase involved in cell wall biosynthesis
MSRIRLAVLAASPVHYQAPLYRRLAADPRVDFTAIFASSSGVRPGKLGYGEDVQFDAPVLDGYRSVFLRRADRNEVDGGSFLRLRDLDVVTQVVRGRYDVLWLQGYYSLTHVAAALAQRLRGGALLIRDDQTLLHRRAGWKRALKQLLFRSLLSGAYGLEIGTENRGWLLHHGIRPERLSFVPYCSDLAPSRLDREAARGMFGIAPDGGPVIASVARLVAKKQPQLLLEAFERVRGANRCTLLFVGTGPLEAELRRLVAERSIPDVVFAGFRNRSEIAHAYAAADVFALASGWDETWGVAVNEAAEAALPLVVTDMVGAARDLVEDGVNGYVVEARDSAALAARLELLVADPALRARLGAASRAIVARWSYDAAAAGVVAAAVAATSSRRRPLAAAEPEAA